MKKTIYMNEDNEHFYANHPASDMTENGLRALVDHYADTGCIRGILFCVNLQRALFDSECWERFRDIRKEYACPYTENLNLLAEHGLDQFKIWLERAAERGVEGWLSMRMNDSHGLKETATGNTSSRCYAWASEYWKKHPELRRAPYRYERDWEGGFDYGKKEVRDHHLALIRELFERYDMFGLECDWMRWGMMFAPGFEREGQKSLTEFVCNVRTLADAAEKRYGHPIKLAHRLPFAPGTAWNAGFDFSEWYRLGCVDMVTISHFCSHVSFDPEIWLWRKLLPECVLNVQVEPTTSPYPGALVQSDPAVMRGSASCAWERGADNLYLFNQCYYESGKMDFLRQTMEEISDPENLKSHSRRMIPACSGFYMAGESSEAVLPVPLIEPAPGFDYGRMEATITLRLNAGFFNPEEDAFVKIGFDSGTEKEKLSGLKVWFNSVELGKSVGESLTDSEQKRIFPKDVSFVLTYRLPKGCLHKSFNALEILPPSIPGNLVWAELYFPGKTDHEPSAR